jgi:PKD repeat protein
MKLLRCPTWSQRAVDIPDDGRAERRPPRRATGRYCVRALVGSVGVVFALVGCRNQDDAEKVAGAAQAVSTPSAVVPLSRLASEQSALAGPTTTTTRETPSAEAVGPSISANAAPTRGEAPLTVYFYGEVTGKAPGQVCRWEFGDGSAVIQQPTTRYTYATPGEYTARFSCLTGARRTQSIEIPISVSGEPFACELEADPDIGLVPLTVQFFAVLDDSMPGPVSVQWDFGDSGVGAGNPASHTYLAPGTFTAAVTVTNGLGQTVRRDVFIQVDGPDEAG